MMWRFFLTFNPYLGMLEAPKMSKIPQPISAQPRVPVILRDVACQSVHITNCCSYRCHDSLLLLLLAVAVAVEVAVAVVAVSKTSVTF